MKDIELVIRIPEDIYKMSQILEVTYEDTIKIPLEVIANAVPLPKGHGRLKDEDEIVKAIEDRVEFLRKNDALFMRLHKDIDILGCIPKIRCEVPTIIEADKPKNGCSSCPHSGSIIDGYKDCPDAYTEKSQHCGLSIKGRLGR